MAYERRIRKKSFFLRFASGVEETAGDSRKTNTAYLLNAENRKKVKGKAFRLCLSRPLIFYSVLRKQNGEAPKEEAEAEDQG